jgi:hypothetical protein
VVVVSWQGADLLPACLDALAAQDVGRDAFDTVVVDNASTDGTADLVRSRYPWVRLVVNDDNRGFAGGNNSALTGVRTDYAVLLNNDAQPEPDWLRRLLAPFGAADGADLGAVTSKVLFQPRYLRMGLATEGFSPGGADPRTLGVRVHRLAVGPPAAAGPGDVAPVEALDEVRWETLTFGPEGAGAARFFWTRPAGEFLVPVPDALLCRDGGGPARLAGELELVLALAAERRKPVTFSWASGERGSAVVAAGPHVPEEVRVVVPAGTPLVDVINNAGGLVLVDGHGADRAYQRVDDGAFDSPEEVFAFCGAAVALRTSAGHDVGWFDDDFFLYYEDTDLSWRLRSRGWLIRYEPTAVVRHVHSASTVEWSPLFVFHTDRNRLLMLTKNADARTAAAQVARYPLTTASMAWRAVRTAWRSRTRPPVRPTLLRLRVVTSYLRLLPRMIGRRRQEDSARTVDRAVLRGWFIRHDERTDQAG